MSPRFAEIPEIIYLNNRREQQLRSGFNTHFQRVQRELNWRFRNKWQQEVVKETWQAFEKNVFSALDQGTGAMAIKKAIAGVGQKLGRLMSIEDFKNLNLNLLEIENPFSNAFFGTRVGQTRLQLRLWGQVFLFWLLNCLLKKLPKRTTKNL